MRMGQDKQMSLRRGSLRGRRRVCYHRSKEYECFTMEGWEVLASAPGPAHKFPSSGEQVISCWTSDTIPRQENREEDTCFHLSLLAQVLISPSKARDVFKKTFFKAHVLISVF